MYRCKHATLLLGFLTCLSTSVSAQSHLESVQACRSADVNSLESNILVAAVLSCTEAMTAPSLSHKETAELLMFRGVALRNAGELNRSLEDLDRSVKLDPNSSRNIRMRAWTLRVMGRLQEAAAEYGRVIKIDREWQGLLSRCNIYIELNQLRPALSDCWESLNLDRNTDSLFMTAFLNEKLGDPEAAIKLLQEAVGRADAEARAFLLLSEILAGKGEKDQAVEIAKDGLRKHQEDKDLANHLTNVSR